MNETPPKLEVGDFVQNKIHGYTSLLYKLFMFSPDHPFIGWDGLIVAIPSEWITDFIKVGVLRSELQSELEKISASLSLIAKAKQYLNALNSGAILDNLTYVEILHKLNEQEKVLKNETQL